MEEVNVNASRFISAYNRLDQGLRDIYSIKKNLNFADMIRKVAGVNTVVLKFEEELISYGRLRNAIVHNSKEEKIIAEPNIEVVEKLEKIARIANDKVYSREIKNYYDEHMCSYPEARVAVISKVLGCDCSEIMMKPNNILGIEYLKALMSFKSGIKPVIWPERQNPHIPAVDKRQHSPPGG